jgi:hypothetical protein
VEGSEVDDPVRRQAHAVVLQTVAEAAATAVATASARCNVICGSHQHCSCLAALTPAATHTLHQADLNSHQQVEQQLEVCMNLAAQPH